MSLYSMKEIVFFGVDHLKIFKKDRSISLLVEQLPQIISGLKSIPTGNKQTNGMPGMPRMPGMSGCLCH